MSSAIAIARFPFASAETQATLGWLAALRRRNVPWRERLPAGYDAGDQTAALLKVDQDRAIHMVDGEGNEQEHDDVMRQPHRLLTERDDNPAEQCLPDAIMERNRVERESRCNLQEKEHVQPCVGDARKRIVPNLLGRLFAEEGVI